MTRRRTESGVSARGSKTTSPKTIAARTAARQPIASGTTPPKPTSAPARRARPATSPAAPAPHGPLYGLDVARAWVSSWVAGALALVGGAVAGLALVVVTMALPNAPASVAGLCVGALLGSGVALTLASRYRSVRRGGGLLILLSPLLVLAAPFLLIAAAVAFLRKTSSWNPPPPADPLETQASEADAGARRARRKTPSRR